MAQNDQRQHHESMMPVLHMTSLSCATSSQNAAAVPEMLCLSQTGPS